MFSDADFRKEKELLKALETPEEKRARRLAKKVRIIIGHWSHLFDFMLTVLLNLVTCPRSVRSKY